MGDLRRVPLLELAEDVLRPRCLARASYICCTRACASALFSDLIFPAPSWPSSSSAFPIDDPGTSMPAFGLSASPPCPGELCSAFFVYAVFAFCCCIVASLLPSACFF